jgi:outer membrane receptor for ferric coprogen and ferric-rhodotorulic acid
LRRAVEPPLQRKPDFNLYNTADLNVIYHVRERLALSATGRNLLQPHHQEFAGNNSNAVGVRRSFFGTVNWTW